MNEIWITSDTHFCHNKDFLWQPRGFNNQWEMNDAIIENWNSIVNPADDVYLLGDVMLSDNEQGLKCLKALKGNIHICVGNHDTDERIKLYNSCYNVVEIEYAYRFKVDKWRFFATHFPTLVGNYDDEKIPTRQLYNLCGHTHTKDMFLDWDKGRIIHTEMDTNNCRPWNINEIIDQIKNKN